MAVNKVEYGNQILIDLTDSTVSPSNLLAGIKAYGANGNPITGTLQLAYHILVTPEQYNELTVAEQNDNAFFFYIKGAEDSSGIFYTAANSSWILSEDEKINYKFNHHEVMIAPAEGSLYADLVNGWNKVSAIPSTYAPESILSFNAFFENTSTWDMSPALMRIKPNGDIEVASSGTASGNLYFSYNYMRENPSNKDGWYYVQANNTPFAKINDNAASNTTVYSASKIIQLLTEQNANAASIADSVAAQKVSNAFEGRISVDSSGNVSIRSGNSTNYTVYTFYGDTATGHIGCTVYKNGQPYTDAEIDGKEIELEL